MLLAFLINFVVLPAPLWVPVVLLFFPRKVARRLLAVTAIAFVCAFAFATRHAADRDPWQWPSAFILGGALWAMFSAALGLLACQLRDKYWRPTVEEGDVVEEANGQRDGYAQNHDSIIPSDNPYESPLE